ncbi:hypothetical protein T12_9630 [Trichinella patagoniensis]|uniref:Uncharacterized protein n=1 Tax=Trichinella patagoniensis TaxID=990121 RepID=A0A0V0ZAD6_9BILA|nr:hypothetical protein T12_9630 [Trichinella patagoniensis]
MSHCRNLNYQAQTTVFLPHYVPPILAEQVLMLREWTSGVNVSGNSSSNECQPGKQNTPDRDLLIKFTIPTNVY